MSDPLKDWEEGKGDDREVGNALADEIMRLRAQLETARKAWSDIDRFGNRVQDRIALDNALRLPPH